MELAFSRIICLAIFRLAEIKRITISSVIKFNLGRKPNEIPGTHAIDELCQKRVFHLRREQQEGTNEKIK
jgi:hypothetical protein